MTELEKSFARIAKRIEDIKNAKWVLLSQTNVVLPIDSFPCWGKCISQSAIDYHTMSSDEYPGPIEIIRDDRS